jgi:hypothetical protein
MDWSNPEQVKAYRRQNEAKRKQESREAGICIYCHIHPVEEGKSICSLCSTAKKERNRNYRKSNIAKGLCTTCGQEALEGYTSCKACMDRKQKSVNARHLERKLDGFCRCGKIAISGKRMCSQCNLKGSKSRYQTKLEVLQAYGGHCVCCGESAPEFLSLDHVNGDGAEDRKKGLKGTRIYRWAKANGYPKTFQLLCHSCNQAKGKGKECPHQLHQREMLKTISTIPLEY